MIEVRSPPQWQYYLNPWWREQRLYVTRLSKAECQRRLNEATTRFLGRRVGRAWLSAADFTLHRVTFYNNGFKPFVYVTLDDSMPPETAVRMTLSGSNSVRLFFVVWYGFLALFAAGVLISTPGRQPPSDLAFPLGIMALFLAWPVVLNAFGRAIAYGDRQFLTTFLVEELELKQSQVMPAPSYGG
ncbi:MAG: hypothetical protein E6I72_12395 [Chloroflexi bacterium]|nr:MAG: hypothetical protein E6I72_12395 [Chloroflexota bacterium]